MDFFALIIAVLTLMILIFVTICFIRSERNADETLKVIMNLLNNNEVVTPLKECSMADVEIITQEYLPDIQILDKDSAEFREKVRMIDSGISQIKDDINKLAEKNDHEHNI